MITPPTHPVAARRSLDLGGRAVELVPLGPGHTDTDLVVHVADTGASAGEGAGTWMVGDVVEESGPPVYGSGCFPLDWPVTLAGLLGGLGPADVVVPGHGRPVARDFVARQVADLAAVAARVRALHAAGASVAQALADARGGGLGWPFPADGLTLAVTRAFASLGGGA